MYNSIVSELLKNKPDFIKNGSNMPPLRENATKQELDSWLAAEKAEYESGRRYFETLYEIARQEQRHKLALRRKRKLYRIYWGIATTIVAIFITFIWIIVNMR